MQRGFALGDVELSFGGQLGRDGLEIAGAGFFEEIVDAGFAGVVSGEGERPVAEATVEAAKVFGGGARVFFGVGAFVGKESGEAVALRGGFHELEKAGGADRAAGFGIEGGFDFGDPDEFGRGFFGDENLFEPRDEGIGFARNAAALELAFPGGALEGQGRRRFDDGDVFGAWLGAVEFIGYVEIVEASLEPLRKRESLFPLFEEGDDFLGLLTKRGQLVDGIGLEAGFEIDEKTADAIAVDVFEQFENFVVEIFFGPFLGAGEEVVDGDFLLSLRAKVEGKKKQNGDGDDALHATVGMCIKSGAKTRANCGMGGNLECWRPVVAENQPRKKNR